MPGATLQLNLDTRVPAESGGASLPLAASRMQVGIAFLSSFEQMGIVSLGCFSGCSCDVQRINAHRGSLVRNASIFERHNFEVKGASSSCLLRIQVLNETDSGSHKFKVKTVTVADAGNQIMFS